MEMLTQQPDLPVLDTSARWQRDLTGLCAVAGGTSFCWVVVLDPVQGLALSAAGAVAGALFGSLSGGVVRSAMDRMRRRLPLWSLALLTPVLGAVLGVAIGELALLMALPVLGLPTSAWAFFETATHVLAPIGALLASLLWLPYAMTAVLRLERWPVLVAMALLAPLISFTWVFFVIVVVV